MQVESIANSGAKIIVLFALSAPTAKVLSEAEYEACIFLPLCSSLTSIFFYCFYYSVVVMFFVIFSLSIFFFFFLVFLLFFIYLM